VDFVTHLLDTGRAIREERERADRLLREAVERRPSDMAYVVLPTKVRKAASKPKPRPTECRRGHAYAEHGYIGADGRRICRICITASRVVSLHDTCRKGTHSMTDPANVITTKDGTRRCRACRQASNAARRAKAGGR